jgi:hypothetical protein
MKAPIESDGTSNLTPEQVKAEAASVAAKAALTTAGNKAKANPTPANIAAMKDAFAASQAAPSIASTAAATIKDITNSIPAIQTNIATATADTKAATASADAAAKEAAAVGTNGVTFPKAGTLLRYKAGKATGSRIAVYADGNGGEFDGEETNNPVNPSSTGFTDTGVITLASNTFANTIGLLMGELEASQPWVEELRTIAQGFINTGSSVDESINLALRDAKAQGKASKFVQRFSAIFKLQDRLNSGETVQVPTIAEYVNSEQALGDVFRSVGLGDLANQETAAKILGDANKSVSEATSIIVDVFNTIDNAPETLKADLQQLAPGLDRTSLAKALLLGKEGAAELTKKVASISQISAAKSQGVAIDSAMGSDLAAGGATYGSSLGKFATVKQLERGQSLGQMSGIDFTQNDAIASTFNSSAAADEKIRRINEEEQNRFAARGGRLASQDRALNQY